LFVGLALWHLKGLRKTHTFALSNLFLREWGIQSDAKSRALRALEREGLIAVERRSKRSPLVTLIEQAVAPLNPEVVETRHQPPELTGQ
jgi:hypothetical protein